MRTRPNSHGLFYSIYSLNIFLQGLSFVIGIALRAGVVILSQIELFLPIITA